MALPYFKKREGPKFLIGDNSAFHLSVDIIKICSENQIRFIFLPSNSTHITQPLVVAFFGTKKMSWRKLLEEWKQGPGRRESSVTKDKFPSLLKNLFDTLKEKNVLSGFKKCGIYPLCRQKVLSMLPTIDAPNNYDGNNSGAHTGGTTPVSIRLESIDDTFKDLLKAFREFDTPKPKKRRTKVKVTPGSLEVKDFDEF